MQKQQCWTAITATLAVALSLPSAANETERQGAEALIPFSIEELLTVEVYGASKFVQKTTEAPSSVTIVTAADIKNYGYRTLADVLASVRGLFVTSDRNYQYLGARGFNRPGDYNSRILLLVDGNRVNDTNYDTASIGQEFLLDVDLIERVEVVRGPGSSIYGSNAFFGVVNVFTRRGRDIDGLELSGAAASFDSGKGRASYGRQLENGAEVLLSATYSDSRGQELSFPEFGGSARNLDHDRAQRFYGKLAYDGLSFSAAYSERSKGVPTASFGSVFNDPRTQARDSQALLDLGYQGRLSADAEISGRVFYGGYFYDATFPYEYPPVVVNKDKAWSEWLGAEAKLVSRFGRHKLVTGVEYQDNFRQDQKNFDLEPYLSLLDERQRSARRAVYAQDEMTLGEALLLNAGLRYDHYSTVGDSFNPRLALIYTVRPETTLKFLGGTAFRAPNTFELYYASAALGSKPGPNLKPERITSYEIVAEHRFLPNFRLTASVYRNEIRDLITQVTDPADGLSLFRNVGKVEARGAEFEVERAWADDTRLRASYAWQVTRDQGSGVELENSPRHLAKFNYSAPLPGNGLRTGLEIQYSGSRRTLSGASAGGYAVANLTLLSQRLAKDLELSASVYNLLDRHYADPGRPEHLQDLIPQDGRSFRFKLTYRI